MRTYGLYIPFFYFFSTRAKTILHRFSFFVLIIFPVFYCAFADLNFTLNVAEIFCLVLGFVCLYCAYEIGYIYNDVYTTKQEDNPSFWLKPELRVYVDKHYYNLITVRCAYILVFAMAIKLFNKYSVDDFLLSLLGLYIVFALHNIIRSRWNILTNFLLQIIKYTCMLTLTALNKNTFKIALVIIISIPVQRGIEFLKKGRFNIKIAKKINISVFRVIYHLALVITGVLLRNYHTESFHLLVINTVLLLYRIASIVAVKNRKIRVIRESNFEDVK